MSHDNVDDLIALARRGLLSEPESRRLRMALHTSESARALHEVGLSFDASTTTLPGDGELLARVTRRVASQSSATSAPVGMPRRQRIFFTALALLVAGAAAASVASLVLDPSPHASDSSATTSPPAERARTRETPTPTPGALPTAEADQRSTRGDLRSADLRSADLRAADPSSAPVRTTTRPTTLGDTGELAATREPPKATERPEPASAAALFKTANAARKAGNATSALDGYRQLQGAFPASPEARVSRVLAGRLLLGSGQASSALAQFDSYLRGGDRGGLAEEALWGKAQALARLGRTSEERAVWQTLLQKFPKSVYAATARQRLEQ